MHLPEYRPAGSRNFIRVGDVVKVTSIPGQPGFEAVVKAINADDEGNVQHLMVLGGARGKLANRFIRPERIKRVAQVRGGEKRERRR